MCHALYSCSFLGRPLQERVWQCGLQCSDACLWLQEQGREQLLLRPAARQQARSHLCLQPPGAPMRSPWTCLLPRCDSARALHWESCGRMSWQVRKNSWHACSGTSEASRMGDPSCKGVMPCANCAYIALQLAYEAWPTPTPRPRAACKAM